jgi:phosphoribosylformimino-5-aminoimidazole carboxamide ribotide isomerase
MIVIPAVDILDKKVVRLEKGNFDKKKVYSQDPETVIERYIELGFNTIHVVNLEGAKDNKSLNLLVKLVKKFPNRLQVAGGISNYNYATKLLNEGAKSVVIGSAAARKEEWIKTLAYQYKDRVIVALDVVENEVKSSGWLKNTNLSIYNLLDHWYHKGINNFLVTDIDRDGLLSGPNIKLYRKILNRYVGIKLIASGGVSSIEDIKRLEQNKLNAVVVGKAIYENKINLGELNAS